MIFLKYIQLHVLTSLRVCMVCSHKIVKLLMWTMRLTLSMNKYGTHCPSPFHTKYDLIWKYVCSTGLRMDPYGVAFWPKHFKHWAKRPPFSVEISCFHTLPSHNTHEQNAMTNNTMPL